MLIVLGLYAGVIWLVFLKLKLLPWSRGTQAVVGVVGLVIILVVIGLLNTRTPSGRVTIVAKVVEIAPVVGGVVASVPVVPNTPVQAGDVLLELDKRPFQFAVDEAEAAVRLATVTLERQETVLERSASISRQDVDETRAELAQAEARLNTAQYNLEQTAVIAPANGVVTSIGVSAGDQAQPLSPVMPFISSDSAFVAGVFSQNGLEGMPVGTPVKIILDRTPGIIYDSKVVEIARGTGSGQIPVGSDILSALDIGSSAEALVVLAWPDELNRDLATTGTVGSATAFGPDAGAMGMLATVLLYFKMIGTYL